MNKNTYRYLGQGLYVAGILCSLAAFVLHALPSNWGVFLSAACFIVGSVFWPGWNITGGKGQ